MNQTDDEQNKIKNFTQKQSSPTYITAWQIESTLNNMQEFIKLIEVYEPQRLKLRSILPHISRIKKIDEQKSALIKELMEITKMNVPFQQARTDPQKQKKITIGHENRIKQIIKSLTEQSKAIEKQITSIKSTKNETRLNFERKSKDRKQELISQINSLLSNQINFLSEKISQNQQSFNIGTQGSIYEAFIEGYLSKRLLQQRKSSQIIKSFSEISYIHKSNLGKEEGSQELKNQNQGKIDFDIFSKNLENIQTQIGEVKCKILSLQDKKRKITVQNLLRYKKQMKEIDGCGFQTTSTSKSIKLTKQITKAQKILSEESAKVTTHINSRKKEENFFTSIFSIFSNKNEPELNTQIQQRISQNFIKSSQNKSPLPSSQQQTFQKEFSSSISQIQDSENKLRMIEINSQILQLREHINIIVNQNIFDQIVASVMAIQEINSELDPLLDQLIEVANIFGFHSVPSKSQQITNLTPFQSPKSISSKKLSISSKISVESVKSNLNENQNIKFFIGIIDSKFKHRVQIIQNMVFSLQYSISVAIKYLRKRFTQIKDQYQTFIENDINKDNKIKATQALKSRTQVLLINSELEALDLEINQLIERRLVKFEELFKIESLEFKKYFEMRGEQIEVLQKIVVNQEKDLQIEKDELKNRFFSFYENLITKTLGIFNLK